MGNIPLKKASSDRGNNPELEWQDIFLFLMHGQYDQAEALFKRLQEEKMTWQADLQIVVTVASQICRACAQLKSEEEWYRSSYRDVLKREHELEQELGKIARQLMEWDLSQAGKIVQDPQRDIKRNGITPTNPSRRTVLKQYFHKLLLHKPALVTEKSTEIPITTLPSQNEEPDLLSPVEEKKSELPPTHSMLIFCLGMFQVYLDGQIVVNWPSCKGKSIFKYLVTHTGQPVAKEILMDLFWPNASPESARRNLNWSIHSMRQALQKNQPDFSQVLFQAECYLLNPDLQIWVDVDEFKAHIRKAQMLEEGLETVLALREYQAAEVLYQGEFLEEDRYEDWIFPIRQSMQNDYLNLLDRLSFDYYSKKKYNECVNLCNKMLATDPCREEAHLRLMQCYYQQGYPYLAIRQYHLCVEKLKTELDVAPSQKITTLFDEIRHGEGKLPLV